MRLQLLGFLEPVIEHTIVLLVFIKYLLNCFLQFMLFIFCQTRSSLAEALGVGDDFEEPLFVVKMGWYVCPQRPCVGQQARELLDREKPLLQV